MFCFAGCIDKLSLQRSLGSMIIFYFLKSHTLFNKFHCFVIPYTILNSHYVHFNFPSVSCVDSIWLLYRGNAAQILFLLSWSCSTVVIHRVVRVITIACNYSFIAWLNNVPNIIPVESFFGTVQYYFTFLDNQNRISKDIIILHYRFMSHLDCYNFWPPSTSDIILVLRSRN